MPLTDAKIKNAKPRPKVYKLFDGGGLFILVKPNGSKLWRLAYRHEGKQSVIALGAYPDISLAGQTVAMNGGEKWIDGARELAAQARRLLGQGVDPAADRKARKAAQVNEDDQLENTFEAVAREWFGRFKPGWVPGHARTIMLRLNRYVFPVLGSRPIGEVKAPELLALLRQLEDRGVLETAHRVKAICSQVFRFAVATGRAERDPSADLRGALPPKQPRHFSAILDPPEIARLLVAIEAYQGTHPVKCALQLAPLVFVRPGELRRAEWSEVSLDAAEWTIPAEKMKIGMPHTVPLSRQAVTILRDLQPLTGGGRYLFPSVRTPERPMSENTVNAALRGLGYPKEVITGHGFRAMARTILDEVLHYRVDVIEHQLAHTVRDPLGRAYNRTQHLDERRKMMQGWADYLDELKGE